MDIGNGWIFVGSYSLALCMLANRIFDGKRYVR
jgi:hypothetical protein